MMGGYRVIWRWRVVDQQMAAAVVHAMERGEDVNAITAAIAEIDHLLSQAPLGCGESREGQERVLVVSPVRIFYEVHEEESTVIVLDLRYSLPRQR